jgi:tripartite-type tricarboxylate transporter receptor subunit TctC
VSTTRRRALAGALAAAVWPGGAQAQAGTGYPSRPVTLVVPFAPGGIADLTARAVVKAMGESLGQPFVVDNRPGAGGVSAGTAVARAAPDGHTLLLISNGTAVSASLFRSLPFDPVRDFAPVTTLGFFELALFVASGGRFADLGELVGWARANPGKLTIGTIAIGSTQHLAAELFKSRAGIDAVVVPYKATPALLVGLRGGEVDLAVEILGPMLAQAKAGTIHALAVTGAERHPALPRVPTVREAGIADYNVASWNALAAPAHTPAAIVDRLQRAAAQALAEPAVRDALQALGVRPQAGSPEQARSLLASEIRRWGQVVQAAKIEPQ